MEKFGRDILRVASGQSAPPSPTAETSKATVQGEAVRPLTVRDVMRRGREITRKRDEQLFREEELASNVYLIENGSVLLGRMDAEGHARTADLCIAGDICGYTFDKEYAWTATVAQDIRARVLPKGELDKAMRGAESVKFDLLLRLDTQLQRSRELLALNHVPHMRARLASFALWGKRHMLITDAERGQIDVPIHNYDLAELLGVAHETASRAMSELAKEGVMEYRRTQGGRGIKILDEQALRRIADE